MDQRLLKASSAEIYTQDDVIAIDKDSPEYTICQKMSVSEEKTVVQYLFDEGKCGEICRGGNTRYLNQFVQNILFHELIYN